MRDLAFAMVWMVLFPVAIWSAHIGVLLWIWVALISPNEQLFGFMAGVPFNKLVAAVTTLVLFFNREKKKFYLDAIVVCILLLAVLATGSAFFSLVPTDDGWDLYQKLLKEFALALLITGLMWSRHRIHMTVLVYCLSIGFIGVVEGLEYLVSGGGHKILGSGAIGDNNSIALAVLMIIPLLYYLMRYSALKWVRVVMGVVIAISVTTVIGTYSRGGFVGLVIVGGAFVLNSKNKMPSLVIALVGVAAVLFLAPADWYTRIDSIRDAGDNSSFMGRVIAWKISTLIAIDNPFFGGGFHAVQRFPVWAHFTPLLPRLDFIATPEPDSFPHAAHSIYFEVLGDLGPISTLLFVVILLAGLYQCTIVIRRTRRVPSLQWASDLARMLQVSLLVYMVAGALLSMAYYEGFWILVAIISRTHKVVRDTLAADPALVQEAAPNRRRVRAATPEYAKIAAP